MATPSTTSSAPSSTPSIVLDGFMCTPQDLIVPAQFLHCLTRTETIGLTLITVSGSISLFAVLTLFMRIIINVVLERRRPDPRNLVRVPMDIYMLSLFSANLVHAIAQMINIKWLHDGKVFVGGSCWSQGVIGGIGTWTIALTTLAIAVHSCCVIYWSRGINSLLAPCIVVIFLWLVALTGTAAIFGSHRNPQQAFVGPATQWCFIRNSFFGFGIAEEWVWVWLADVVCICAYVSIFIWFLVADRKQTTMLLIAVVYPVVYTIMVIPKSVTRVIEQATNLNAPTQTMAFEVFFNLIGFVDVVVFLATRRGLLLIGNDKPQEYAGGAPPIGPPIQLADRNPNQSQDSL